MTLDISMYAGAGSGCLVQPSSRIARERRCGKPERPVELVATRLAAMKRVLIIAAVLAVLIGVTKLRRRGDADLWHEVTTR